MDATVHGPGQGLETHAVGNDARTQIKVGGEQTAGSFFMCETTVPAGFPGPPLHRHRTLHDMFFVLEGTLTLRVGDDTREAGPGTFACFPPGVAHTFSNPSDAPVRFLNFNTPSGWEHYMRDLAEAARSGPMTPERIGAVASRYDIEVV